MPFLPKRLSLRENQTVRLRHQTVNLRLRRGSVSAWGVCDSRVAVVVIK